MKLNFHDTNIGCQNGNERLDIPYSSRGPGNFRPTGNYSGETKKAGAMPGFH